MEMLLKLLLYLSYVEFEVFTEVNIKSRFFWISSLVVLPIGINALDGLSASSFRVQQLYIKFIFFSLKAE
jgi:hypothetical protein